MVSCCVAKHTSITGSGGYTHKYFRAPPSADDLAKTRDAITSWARMTYGWMGRSLDSKAAFLATLGANSDFYAPYQDNARRWYHAAQGYVRCIHRLGR